MKSKEREENANEGVLMKKHRLAEGEILLATRNGNHRENIVKPNNGFLRHWGGKRNLC